GEHGKVRLHAERRLREGGVACRNQTCEQQEQKAERQPDRNEPCQAQAPVRGMARLAPVEGNIRSDAVPGRFDRRAMMHQYFPRRSLTMRCAMRLSPSVIRKSRRPRAKAASVLGLSKALSPVSRVTICTVTVVTASNGFGVNFAISPAAMT